MICRPKWLKCSCREMSTLLPILFFASPAFAALAFLLPSLISALHCLFYPKLAQTYWRASCLSLPQLRTRHTATVVAPPIRISISHRSFVEAQCRWFAGRREESLSLHGLSPGLEDSQPAFASVIDVLPGSSPRGLLASSSRDQLPKSPIVVPEPMSLIWDSAKLAGLDALLDE